MFKIICKLLLHRLISHRIQISLMLCRMKIYMLSIF
nr:MAG TPA: hypothetical protein [Bacteriophage sp.]DAT29094.1 MAG TPA: hypothetical protein [Caudoviricetes sp.]